MPLKHQEIEEVWRKQEAALPNKPVGLWLIPLVLLFPLLAAKFSPDMVRSCMIAGGAYLLYGAITHLAWHLWSRSNKKATVQKRITMLLILGYNGLSLLFISIACLSAAILMSTGYLPSDGNTIAIAIMVTYLTSTVFTVSRAAHFLRSAKPVKPPTQFEMRLALQIRSALAGAGVVLGAVLARSRYGIIVGVGLATVVAFLLLPFGVVMLYTVIILAWDWLFGHKV